MKLWFIFIFFFKLSVFSKLLLESGKMTLYVVQMPADHLWWSPLHYNLKQHFLMFEVRIIIPIFLMRTWGQERQESWLKLQVSLLLSGRKPRSIGRSDWFQIYVLCTGILERAWVPRTPPPQSYDHRVKVGGCQDWACGRCGPIGLLYWFPTTIFLVEGMTCKVGILAFSSHSIRSQAVW